MINRRFALETATIIIAAVACAAVSNGLAARDRKVKWLATSSAAAKRIERPATAATQPVQASVVPLAAATAPLQPAAVAPAAEAKPVESGAAPAAAEPAAAAAKPAAQAVAPAPVTAQQPVTPAPAVAAKQFPPHPDKAYIEISSDDAKLLYDGGAIFFDARRTSVYEEGHIRGARNISVWEADLDEKINKLYEENLDPEKPIVVYCSGGACEDSHMLSQRLWGIGLNAVFVYKDGFPDWQAKGRPVSTGAQP